MTGLLMPAFNKVLPNVVKQALMKRTVLSLRRAEAKWLRTHAKGRPRTGAAPLNATSAGAYLPERSSIRRFIR